MKITAQPSLAKIKISPLLSVRPSTAIFRANNKNMTTLPTSSSNLHSHLHYSLPSSSLRHRMSSPVSNSANSSTASLIGPPGKKDAQNSDMKDGTVSGALSRSFGLLRECAIGWSGVLGVFFSDLGCQTRRGCRSARYLHCIPARFLCPDAVNLSYPLFEPCQKRIRPIRHHHEN